MYEFFQSFRDKKAASKYLSFIHKILPGSFEVTKLILLTLKLLKMKKTSTLLFVAVLTALCSMAQISFNEVNVEDWIGSGPNEAMFIVDFDSDPIGTDSAFAWGINFEGDSISGDAILSMIAEADENFTYTMNGNFLDNINYFTNNQNYTNPNSGWFSILESTDGITWNWNNGLSDNIANNQWFGIVVMNEETWEAEINVPLLTFIENENLVKSFEVYPNPASHQLNIKMSNPAQIMITDLNGQIVYETFSAFEKIDLSDFQAGMYLVTVVQANSISYEKIVVK